MTNEEKKEYQRQWYLTHREEQLEKRRKYYQEHKEELLKKVKIYTAEHKEEIKARQKIWNKEHKEHLSEKRKEYYNKYYKEQYFSKYCKEYYKKNKDKLIEYSINYRISRKQPIVYKYIDITTNEIVYIGSTENLLNRLSHRRTSENTAFAKAYREEPEKYKFEIVCETETREQAYEIEKLLINDLNPKFNILKYKNVQEI